MSVTWLAHEFPVNIASTNSSTWREIQWHRKRRQVNVLDTAPHIPWDSLSAEASSNYGNTSHEKLLELGKRFEDDPWWVTKAQGSRRGSDIVPGKFIRCQPSASFLSSTVKGLWFCSAPWFFFHHAKEGRRRDNSDVFYYTPMIIPQGRIAKFGYREISNHDTWGILWCKEYSGEKDVGSWSRGWDEVPRCLAPIGCFRSTWSPFSPELISAPIFSYSV